MRSWLLGGALVAASLFCGGVLFLSPVPASAGLLNFNLGSCAQVVQPCVVNTNTGTPVLDFLNGVFDLRTEGFIGVTPSNLFVKNTGVGDVGLGLAADIVHEISPGESVTLDLSGLASHGFTSGSLTLESLDSGEVGTVTDQTGTTPVIELGSSLTNTVPISFSTLDPFVTVSAASGSVLAAADLEVTVPEAAPFLLALTAILGVVVWRRHLA
jgi:hypothetical protein